ncbi:hypothetical protein QBC45DRAFT_450274 [Copromyces sp. CBS 386.78]|nr:hypothetical protein QBC45DRAFT_450274 [Copromyces sp. CBS 386.78]
MSAPVNKVTVKLTPSLPPLGVHYTVEQQPTVPSTITTKPDDTGSASSSAPVPMADVAATTTAESKPTVAATDNLKPATDAHPDDDKKDAAEKPKTFPTAEEVVAEKMALEPTAAGSEFHGFETATPSAPTSTAIFDAAAAPAPEKTHENPRSDAVPTGDGLPESIEDASAGGPAGAGTVLPNGEAAPDLEKTTNEAKEAAATNPDQALAAAPLGENGTNGVAGAAKKDEEGDTEMKNNISSETVAKASDPTQAAERVKAAPAPLASKKRKAKDSEEENDDEEKAVNGNAKKVKTTTGDGETNGDGAASSSPVKRAPGRPKKTATEKVEKAARKILKPVGMTQRKTRSQGPA